MKNLVFILIIVLNYFSSSSTNAQPVLGTTYFYKLKGTNEYTFYLYTSFSFGSGGGCPNIDYVKIQKSKDTLYLKAVYAIWGVWATMGCNSLDSIKYTNTDLSINYINVSTNSAKYAPPDYKTFDTAWNLFDSTFLIGTAQVKNHQLQSSLDIYPNPASNSINLSIAANELKVYNTLGQIVLQGSNIAAHQPISVSQLSCGLYYLAVYDKEKNKIGVGKFYKE